MKKMFMLLSLMLFAIVLTGCFSDVDTLEWETFPDSIFIKDSATLDDIDEDVKIKINGTSYTLSTARLLPDVTVSGFDTSTVGKGLITIKYKTLTIYYEYEVVDEIPNNEPIVPDTSWYVSGSSPYTLNSIEDLYGLAKLVNEKTHDFAGEIVKLAVDIDLSDKVWTPIGESARKVVVSKTFEDLVNANVNKPNTDESEEDYIVRLNALPKTLTKYVYLGNYYFAEKISDTEYVYKWSDQNLESDSFFAGTFDGQGHTIKGLSDVGYNPLTSIVYANSSRVTKATTFGLFGAVDGNVTVKNLNFEGVTITGAYYDENDGLIISDLDSVGAVIGYAFGTGNLTLDNIKVLSGTIAATFAGAGLVGRIYTKGEILIQNCENRANVTISSQHAGGIAGYISGSTKIDFINNINYGNITCSAPTNYAGAMVHQVPNLAVKANFTNCRNFGNITGTDHTGLGMVGKTASNGLFSGCVNYGVLTKVE